MTKPVCRPRLLACMFAAAFALPAGPTYADPSHGDYVGKSTAEIAKNLLKQEYKFREYNRDDGSLLEVEVVRDGKPYEIFADPRTGRIVKIIVGDESNEIPMIRCTQRSKFVRYLADTYAERPVAIGITGNGSVTELLNSITGESRTIIKTTPDGITCKVASGEHWQPLQREFRPVSREHLRRKAFCDLGR